MRQGNDDHCTCRGHASTHWRAHRLTRSRPGPRGGQQINCLGATTDRGGGNSGNVAGWLAAADDRADPSSSCIVATPPASTAGVPIATASRPTAVASRSNAGLPAPSALARSASALLAVPMAIALRPPTNGGRSALSSAGIAVFGMYVDAAAWATRTCRRTYGRQRLRTQTLTIRALLHHASAPLQWLWCHYPPASCRWQMAAASCQLPAHYPHADRAAPARSR